MSGDHFAIIANWWRIAFVSPFAINSPLCESSIRELRTRYTYYLSGETFHYQCIIRSYYIETKVNSLCSCLYHYGNLFSLHDTNLTISYTKTVCRTIVFCVILVFLNLFLNNCFSTSKSITWTTIKYDWSLFLWK